jgi:hypothetical protein
MREIFEAGVEKTPNGCWLWRGKTMRVGPKKTYGVIPTGRSVYKVGRRHAVGGSYIYVHRVAWRLSRGQWPRLPVVRTCREALCVRDDHLKQLSTARTGKVGRRAKSTAKLTPDAVVAVVAMFNNGLSNAEIAGKLAGSGFHVTEFAVALIRRRSTWKDVTAGLSWPAPARRTPA